SNSSSSSSSSSPPTPPFSLIKSPNSPTPTNPRPTLLWISLSQIDLCSRFESPSLDLTSRY
ncbi:hypothetical protein TorRG33x02_034210, partial [Trema orientale]